MFWLTMGYETHPNDSQQVFVDLFLYTTVVKWTRKNKNVFVYVKCFYVTVGLIEGSFDGSTVVAHYARAGVDQLVHVHVLQFKEKG